MCENITDLSYRCHPNPYMSLRNVNVNRWDERKQGPSQNRIFSVSILKILRPPLSYPNFHMHLDNFLRQCIVFGSLRNWQGPPYFCQDSRFVKQKRTMLEILSLKIPGGRISVLVQWTFRGVMEQQQSPLLVFLFCVQLFVYVIHDPHILQTSTATTDFHFCYI